MTTPGSKELYENVCASIDDAIKVLVCEIYDVGKRLERFGGGRGGGGVVCGREKGMKGFHYEWPGGEGGKINIREELGVWFFRGVCEGEGKEKRSLAGTRPLII